MRLFALFVGWLSLVSAAAPAPVALDVITGETLPARLSDFRFFVGGKPNTGVQRYNLSTELFSDYTDKQRFMFVPAGRRATPRDDGDALDFPEGSALIKHFGYGERLIETRVLLRRASGWVALPYVWEGDDAVLRRAGKRLPVSFTRNEQVREISYAVPNQNQCKGCHAVGDAIMPIGPRLSTLQAGGQYARLVKAGVVPQMTLPAAMPRWSDQSASLDARARAYLDINCAHCHSRAGPASNSGLFLGWRVTDRAALGVGKRPVAAGRGAGDFEFAIAPGRPDRSILIYRMNSLDPSVAMPELGRATVHDEGVELLSEWIRTLQ